MIQAAQSALQGMNRNQNSMVQHSNRISSIGSTDDSGNQLPVVIHEEMVGMMVSQRGFEANVSVIRTADEMLGTLIDILA